MGFTRWVKGRDVSPIAAGRELLYALTISSGVHKDVGLAGVLRRRFLLGGSASGNASTSITSTARPPLSPELGAGTPFGVSVGAEGPGAAAAATPAAAPSSVGAAGIAFAACGSSTLGERTPSIKGGKLIMLGVVG